ncbi:TIGR00730 family Rossman fold protein [candidate division KSB1 bacterium]
MDIQTVSVFCGSSDRCDIVYLDAAYQLGEYLAEAGINILYGGGGVGLMGKLARGALSKSGKITGIIPRFMYDNGWGHSGLTELRIVESMHERKLQMLTGSDAFIALPGGCGTLEELLEAITWKQLNLHSCAIVIININHYFDCMQELLKKAEDARFMDEKSHTMWIFADTAPEAVQFIKYQL